MEKKVGDAPALVRVVAGEALARPPLWIMRQAGRYLPEYRETRKQAGSFLDLCYSPKLAAEVTLQPIRRFDFDAAILFSDILVIADALGQRVRFVEGEGPLLDDWSSASALLPPGQALERLAPVLEAVRLVRRALPADKALIGFCGAPWTVATYMIGGRGSPDQRAAKLFALRSPARFQELIDILVDVSARYLISQLQAGADVVKLFDTWAGNLDESGFNRWAVAPARELIARVKAAVPGALVIAFPKGAGARLGEYAAATKADAVAVDWTMPMRLAREAVPEPTALQGNLDPMHLIAGGGALDAAVDAILDSMRGRAHVFNLGHGITPETPLANVERLVARVKGRAVT